MFDQAQGKSLSPTDRVSYAYRVGEELWISRAIGGVGKEFLSPCMPSEIRLSGFHDNPGVIVEITRAFYDSPGGAVDNLVLGMRRKKGSMRWIMTAMKAERTGSIPQKFTAAFKVAWVSSTYYTHFNAWSDMDKEAREYAVQCRHNVGGDWGALVKTHTSKGKGRAV
ncbi:hypothetical protein C8R47DRAFT_1068960 [Mycena vitilis]|nr:hypothetical protein C8R47DRAFT_1068960 [Mycena vitilis]